jgi:hypothetical protein
MYAIFVHLTGYGAGAVSELVRARPSPSGGSDVGASNVLNRSMSNLSPWANGRVWHEIGKTIRLAMRSWGHTARFSMCVIVLIIAIHEIFP